jgi:hypothetical protein
VTTLDDPDKETWMNLRRFRALREAGATYAEIGRECGVDWRTVKMYLSADAPAIPPVGPSRKGTQPQVIEAQHEGSDGADRAGPSPPARHAAGSVTPLQQIPVPSQDRLRPHQQLHTAQRLPR